MKPAGLLLALLLAGCSSISGNPIRDLFAPGKVSATTTTLPSSTSLAGVVVQGLQDATWNLDQAVLVGALDKTDPAPGCFHGILTQLGIDPANPLPPGASYTPKVSDGISAGSVLYIRLQQAKRMQGGGITAPSDCKALIGQFFMDAAAAGLKIQPGGGLLPVLK